MGRGAGALLGVLGAGTHSKTAGLRLNQDATKKPLRSRDRPTRTVRRIYSLEMLSRNNDTLLCGTDSRTMHATKSAMGEKVEITEQSASLKNGAPPPPLTRAAFVCFKNCRVIPV